MEQPTPTDPSALAILERINAEIAKWSYKPTFRFFTRFFNGETVDFVLTMRAPSLSRPDKNVSVAFHKTVYLNWFTEEMTAHYVQTVLHDLVVEAEIHEAYEWLRKEGKPFFNPHLKDRVVINDQVMC